jgi:hypothetical protein
MKTLNKLAVTLMLATLVVACGEQSITVSPAAVTLDQGATQTFTADAKGVKEIEWSVEGGAGSITSGGVFTAPSAAGTVVVVAKSKKDGKKFGTAVVTVRSVEIQVTPATAIVAQGETATFTAAVTGTVNKAVTWSVGAGSAGTIDASSGLFTAATAPGSATVIATSAADGTKTAMATVTVPATQGLVYVDPTGSGWRLVKNAALSTAFHLVLDLKGPAGESGRGVSLTLEAGSDNVAWAKVNGADAELVANHAYQLGAAPQLLKGSASGGTLSAGVFQKQGAAVAVSDAVVSVALDLSAKAILTAKPGVAIPLSVVKAKALPATGSLTGIEVAVGSLVTQ